MKHLPIVTAPLSGRDFARNIARQTDCRWEAYNLSRFQCNFIEEIADETIRVPQVVTGLVRPAVLVETWDSGRLITNAFTGGSGSAARVGDVRDGDGDDDVDLAAAAAVMDQAGTYNTAADDGGPAVSAKMRRQLANRLFDTSLKMFLRDDFVHADLHAGNIMFSTRPSKVPGSKNDVV